MPNLLELWQLGRIRSINANPKKEREIPWETVKPPRKTVKRPQKTVKRPQKTVKTPWILHLEYLKFLSGWSVIFDHSIAATLSPKTIDHKVYMHEVKPYIYHLYNPIVQHPTWRRGTILLDRFVVCACFVCKWHQMTLHEHDLHDLLQVLLLPKTLIFWGLLNDLIFLGSLGLDPKKRGLWKYRVYNDTNSISCKVLEPSPSN